MGKKSTYELFIYEGIKKREALKVKCDYCNKEYLKAKRFIKKGRKNFCCRKCHSEGTKKPRIKLKCDHCNKEYEVLKSRLKNSKSGYHFCSRECKDLAQRIGNGLIKMWPDHYKNGEYADYRKLAFENYKHECELCGYNEHIELLHVHHIDKNRKNNLNVDNLIILCPTCHWSLTMKLAELNEERIYKWMG